MTLSHPLTGSPWASHLSDLEPERRARYGDRDLFAWGNVVIRPDGSVFIQGDLSTYKLTDLAPGNEAIEPSAAEAQLTRHLPDRVDLPGLRRRQGTVNPAGGMQSGSRPGSSALQARSLPGEIESAVHYDLVPDRTVYHERYVERVYVGPGGAETVFRRLRHSTQMPGNPYVRTAKEEVV